MVTKEIKEFKKYLEKNNIQGLALDIDDTIAETGKHWIELIVNEFGNPTNQSIEEIIEEYLTI